MNNNQQHEAPPTEGATFGGVYWDAKSDISKFVKGNKDNQEQVDQLFGKFDAVWKEWDQGNPDHNIDPGWRLRLRLLDRNGTGMLIRAGAKVFTYSLISSLHEVAKDKYIAVRIRPGGKAKVCFADVAVWENQQWHKVRGIELDKNGDRFDEAMDLIEEHDAYIEAPTKADPDDVAASANEEVKAKGWPEIPGAAADLYLELIAEQTGEVQGDLDDVSDAAWTKFRVWVDSQKAIPMKVQIWQKKNGAGPPISASTPKTPAQVAPDEYDPFADE